MAAEVEAATGCEAESPVGYVAEAASEVWEAVGQVLEAVGSVVEGPAGYVAVAVVEVALAVAAAAGSSARVHAAAGWGAMERRSHSRAEAV